jgi:nucleotide-binding universal stress UspA family protein
MTTSTPILCAIDWKPDNQLAVDHAASLARRLNAPLHLLHVVSLPFVPLLESGAWPAELEQSMADQTGRALRAKAEELVATGLSADSRVVSALAIPEAIVQTARELGCKLIVVASGGREVLRRAVLGSVAERVIEIADVDVLAVPRAAASAPKTYRTILCGVDFSAPAEAAFVAACRLAQATSASVHVLHAWEPAGLSAPHNELAEAHERRLAHDLSDLVRRHASPETSVTEHIVRDAPYRAMTKLAAALSCELLVVGASGRSALEHLFVGSTGAACCAPLRLRCWSCGRERTQGLRERGRKPCTP